MPLNFGPVYRFDGLLIQEVEAERNRQHAIYGTKPMSFDEFINNLRHQLHQVEQAEAIDDIPLAKRQLVQILAITSNHYEGL